MNITKEYVDIHIPSSIINFHPPTVAGETCFLEVVKKVIKEDGYVLVGNKSSPLGIITLPDLITIIAAGIRVFSLCAQKICQKFPAQSKRELEDIFTIANLFYKHKYPALGLLNEDCQIEGLITPKSLCQYLSQDPIYKSISVREIPFSTLVEVPADISIVTVSQIIKKQNLMAVQCHVPSQIDPKIITLKDIVSVLFDGQWNRKTLKDIQPDSLPLHSDTETVASLGKSLKSNGLTIINPDSVNISEKHLLEAGDFIVNKIEHRKLQRRKTTVIQPENLLVLLTPSWQQQYLRKQNQKLLQLQTAIKEEKKQVEQEKIFSQLSYRIRQSLNLKEILSNTVEEIRQFLGCDRVIVYQLYADGNGMIVAESVEKEVSSLLGKVIYDHCFAQDYIEPYLNGRIQATDNVFTANLSPCHLDLLLSIDVQANLVVPIVFHNNLWGLLAAQHCQNPRPWQEEELTLLQKLGYQVAIAIQQSEYAETSLKIANYQTAIASLGNAALVTQDLDSLMEKTVEIVSETLKLKYAYILELLPNHAAFMLKACVGWSPKWINSAIIGASSRWMPGYTLKVLHPVVTQDLRVETRFSPSPFLHNQSMVSGASVNIGGKDNLYGVLGVYSQKSRKFNLQEIKFLQTVTNFLATAIEKIKSQRQLDYFFHLSLDMFCITGIDGSFKRVNESFLTTLGYSDGELLSENLIDFVHPDDREITLAELEKLGQGFPSINFENRWRCKDNSYRWLAWKSLPYEEGTIYAVARDITLAKQAEEQLRILNEQLELRVQDRTQELEHTTTQLRTLVQTAGTLLIVLNQEYRILEWNEEAEKIFGWRRDSVLGEDYFLLFVPPSQREKLRGYLDETIKKGKIQRNLESKIINSEGNERCLLWNINRFVDKTGEGIGVIACGQDIEEVRMAQLRLKLSEERFRSIFNQAAVGIVQVSLQGKLVLVNDKFNQLLGYPEEKLSTLEFHQLIYADDVSDTLSDLSALLGGDKLTFQRETRILRYDGTVIWVDLTMSVVWVSVEPSYFIAVVNDISDRKKVEESLQKSEARLNSILNSLQDVVWSISLPNMKLRYINPVCEKIYGKSPAEIMANPSVIRKLAVKQDRKRLEETWQDIVNNSHLGINHPEANQNWELEYQIKLASQETRWIRERVHLVYDRYGRAINIDGISTDVTQSHEAEDKLFKSLREKEVLLKEIHHRVKNNLYVISSLLNLQSSYIEDEEVRNLFQDSQNRIQTMAVIHEQLYQSEDLSEIDFADYLEKLIANLFLSYNSQQSGIKPITNLEHCRLHIETATPAGLLINELVTNAFKHAFPSGKGEIKINLKVDSNQQIHLSVTDNGRGLPPQLNWEESPSLGLRLVRLLSQQLDAEVQVKTNQKGTSFNIEFMPPKSTTKIS
jgi:PAS domain S-box-containing protein